jgi:hypothetical protein
MTDKQLFKLALDALETLMIEHGSIYEKAIAALKERLSQPEQEPVAIASHGVVNWIADKQFQHESDLYTTPPQHTEQNFCSRCGKRTKDIHTCTPPKENT